MSYPKRKAMASQQPAAATDHLHSIAHAISLANETCDRNSDRQAIPNIMHVSGTPFKSQGQAAYLSESSARGLRPWQLDHCGHKLHCAFDRVLGHGGFARVYSGKVMAVNPPCSNLATRVTALWTSFRPFIHLGSSLIAMTPLQPLISASRMLLHISWLGLVRVADVFGIARPCAIKALQDTSSNKGAYGTRSIEHEVLISLHVSHACASCPYVGKAYGFEVASAARPVPSSPHCVADSPPSSATADHCEPNAVLLVLEPYVADLAARLREHERHADSSDTEFPCHKCLDAAGRSAAMQKCGCGDVSSAAGMLLASPVLAARMAAGALLNACYQLPLGDNSAGCRRQVSSLWEYAASIRKCGLQLSVAEVLRLALELAEAISAIHDKAHVMHLDIKPQNVLLDRDLHVKLVDWGLSAAFTPDRPFIILPQLGRGTRPYTSPEMLLVGTSGMITPAADIYSFGCCMLTMCVNGRTSAPPGAAHEPVGLLKQGITRSTDLAPFVPPELDSILKDCLSKHAFERPTAADLVADLKAAHAAFNKHGGHAATPAPVRRHTSTPVASPPLAPPSPSLLPRHLPHAAPFAELQQRYQHLRVSLDVLVPGGRASPGPGVPRSAKHCQHSPVLTPSRLSSECGSCIFSRSGTVQFESHSRSGGSMQGCPDVCAPCRSGEVQPRKRMPYTTSVRVGLAGISRPLHALTPHSSSGWFSDGSMSCASFAAPSVA